MAKVIKNPVEVKLVFEEEEDIITVECSAHYGMTCEHGVLGRKGMAISLTSAQEQAIKGMALAIVLPQILVAEGI